MDGLTPSSPVDDTSATLAAERAEWKADLRELRRLGMRVSRHVVMHSLGPEPEPGTPEPDPPPEMSPEEVLMFARASHVVRMVLALEDKIATNASAREHTTAAQSAQPAQRKWRNPKRDLLAQIVEASIWENADKADTGRLMDELHEVLQDPALDAQFVDRRMADVATEVCEGFGIRPHFRNFTDQQLDYNIVIDRSGWKDLPKLPKGMVGEPGIPSAYEMQERAAGRPWPPKMGQAPPKR